MSTTTERPWLYDPYLLSVARALVRLSTNGLTQVSLEALAQESGVRYETVRRKTADLVALGWVSLEEEASHRHRLPRTYGVSRLAEELVGAPDLEIAQVVHLDFSKGPVQCRGEGCEKLLRPQKVKAKGVWAGTVLVAGRGMCSVCYVASRPGDELCRRKDRERRRGTTGSARRRAKTQRKAPGLRCPDAPEVRVVTGRGVAQVKWPITDRDRELWQEKRALTLWLRSALEEVEYAMTSQVSHVVHHGERPWIESTCRVRRAGVLVA